MSLDVKIDGLNELQKRLKQLGSPKLVKRIGNKALRAASNIVKKAAVDNAKRLDDPDSGERIWKNITVRSRRTRNGDLKMSVGVRGGAKQYNDSKENVRKRLAGKSYKTLGDKNNPGGDTWYFRFIEYGTSRQPATPFMRPALEQNIEAATNAFSQKFNDELNKELAKL